MLLKYLGEGSFVNSKVIYTGKSFPAMKDSKRRSIFPSNPSAPFVLDCFKWHADVYTSLTHKRERTGFIGNLSVLYCSSTASSLLGEKKKLITSLATLQR